MTFKHLKFAESSTMQAFEKLAKAKGLVKPETATTKTAAKTLDLNPSENLLENILKLAQGLRAQGFSKHANDLENKFLVFKKAESLYETSKETGEDLVDQAHPKGSHKMDGQDHTVLTIVDQKKKIEEIVNKKPSGKLTTANGIIDAVKLALGGDFLGNGGARNHKVAQDKKPAESSGTVGTIAETAGFMGGIAGLKWLWTKFRGSSAIDKQLVKNVEEALGRNLSKAEANALSKQIVQKVGQEEMQKVLGKQVAQEVEKKVTTEVAEVAAKQVAQTAAKNIAENAATKSPGTWARIVSYFRAPVAGTGTAAGGVAAGEAGVAGEGAAAAGGAGVGVAAAAGVASFVVAATITYLAVDAIFENKFYTTDLTESGNNLLKAVDGVGKLPKWQRHSAKDIAFKDNLSEALKAAEAAKTLISNPSPGGLVALKKYADTLQDASTAAYNLSAAARGIYTGDEDMKPGESREDSGTLFNDTIGTSMLGRLIGTDASKLGDVVIMGANFVNVAQKALTQVRMTINKIMDIAAKEEAKHVAAKGGAPIQDLSATYAKYLGLINKWSLQIGEQKSTIKEAQQVLDWLTKYKNAITAEQTNFNAKSAEDKQTVYSFYEKRFNEKVKDTLDNFEKYGKDKGWLK